MSKVIPCGLIQPHEQEQAYRQALERRLESLFEREAELSTLAPDHIALASLKLAIRTVKDEIRDLEGKHHVAR